MDFAFFDFTQCWLYSRRHSVQKRLRQWVRPDSDSLAGGTALNLTRSKSELVLENALLRQQLIVLHPRSIEGTTTVCTPGLFPFVLTPASVCHGPRSGLALFFPFRCRSIGSDPSPLSSLVDHTQRSWSCGLAVTSADATFRPGQPASVAEMSGSSAWVHDEPPLAEQRNRPKYHAVRAKATTGWWWVGSLPPASASWSRSAPAG